MRRRSIGNGIATVFDADKHYLLPEDLSRNFFRRSREAAFVFWKLLKGKMIYREVP